MRPAKQQISASRAREDNPIVYFDIRANGGFKNTITGKISEPRIVGRIYFELRHDLVPKTCSNFLMLISGARGIGLDGIHYTYKGTKIHRVVSDFLFQGGDLLGQDGNCSRAAINTTGTFPDENFLLRHTGPGILSMCNHGPDTNGSLFQVTLIENPDMDDRYVVFGYAVGDDSYEVIHEINTFGSESGMPTEEIVIYDCGISYPKQPKLKEKPKTVTNGTNCATLHGVNIHRRRKEIMKNKFAPSHLARKRVEMWVEDIKKKSRVRHVSKSDVENAKTMQLHIT
eukprot:gene5799-11703_t